MNPQLKIRIRLINLKFILKITVLMISSLLHKHKLPLWLVVYSEQYKLLLTR